MKPNRVSKPKLRGVVWTLLLMLPLTPGGCEPLSTESLSQFILDLTREALAAWLL